MSLPWVKLVDPITRQPLHFDVISSDSKHGILSSGSGAQRWPVVFGVAFLRFDRLELAERVSTLIVACEFVDALALLLTDTDDFAPTTPSLSDCRCISKRIIANDTDLLAIDVMQALKFGAVANYFSVRGSAPTFFSGLGLLKMGVQPDRPLVEIGCGVGHFLYWLSTRNVEVLGIDTVFSKLYLANRFLGIKSENLICAVAGDKELPIETSGAVNVFCHDAFYFLRNKLEVISDFRRLAGMQGSVLVGHAHLSSADHGAVSGYPLALAEYRQIAAEKAHFFDDESLVAFDMGPVVSEKDIPDSAQAISFIEGNLSDPTIHWWAGYEETLYAPMELTWSHREGVTKMDWPTQAFAEEYRDSEYLSSLQNPFEYLPFQGDARTLRINACLAVPAPFFAFGVRPLRWAVIGGGWIAEDYFVPAFRFTPHARLVAVCDTKGERLNAFSNITGLKLFSDWHEMLATCEVDAVYIATPNFLHAEIFEAVALRGLHILCEKPIATNMYDLSKIECAAQKFNIRFQTAFDQRYHPAHVQLRRRIKEGALGTVTQIRIHYACWVDDGWSKVQATNNWRTDPKQAGGGAGFDLLPHCLDLLLMLTDDSIDISHLIYQSLVHNYTNNQMIDDGAVMTVKTQKGILASIHVGYNCPENQPRRRIEITGTHGYVVALNTMGQDPGGELIWHLNGENSQENFISGMEAGPFVRQLDALCRLWLRSDLPQFPFDKDIALAKSLITSDVEAKNPNLT